METVKREMLKSNEKVVMFKKFSLQEFADKFGLYVTAFKDEGVIYVYAQKKPFVENPTGNYKLCLWNAFCVDTKVCPKEISGEVYSSNFEFLDDAEVESWLQEHKCTDYVSPSKNHVSTYRNFRYA